MIKIVFETEGSMVKFHRSSHCRIAGSLIKLHICYGFGQRRAQQTHFALIMQCGLLRFLFFFIIYAYNVL
jgi:hypothetical protein